MQSYVLNINGYGLQQCNFRRPFLGFQFSLILVLQQPYNCECRGLFWLCLFRIYFLLHICLHLFTELLFIHFLSIPTAYHLEFVQQQFYLYYSKYYNYYIIIIIIITVIFILINNFFRLLRLDIIYCIYNHKIFYNIRFSFSNISLYLFIVSLEFFSFFMND